MEGHGRSWKVMGGRGHVRELGHLPPEIAPPNSAAAIGRAAINAINEMEIAPPNSAAAIGRAAINAINAINEMEIAPPNSAAAAAAAPLSCAAGRAAA